MIFIGRFSGIQFWAIIVIALLCAVMDAFDPDHRRPTASYPAAQAPTKVVTRY